MKTKANKSNSGSVLVTTLIMSAVLGLVLASYLLMLSSRNRITFRSHAWNNALPVLEAGLEEAFTHLHNDIVMTNNGWTFTTVGGQTVYTKQRTFTDGSYFFVTIYNATSNNPIIYSQGYVRTPLTTNQYISRMVQVMATNPVTFGAAVSAKGLVQLSGGAYVDSFNSTDPNYSTNGMYTNTLRRANGRVVTDANTAPAIATSSAHIYGPVDTGPTGTVTGNVGAIGSSGINSNYVSHDMNVTYQDQVAPTGSSGWVAPSSLVTVGGTNYQYALSTGNYKLSALTISQSGPGNPVIVTGTATLLVTGNITVQGSGYIYLAPGANLTLIEGGTTATISGGGIVNGSSLAKNFSYIGLPANTSITYSGSAQFVGTVNAPQANLTISGSAAWSGAAIVNTFNDTGGAAIHYDEGLGGNGLLTMISYAEL